MNKLTIQSLIGLAQLLIVLAILLFLPAWSFNYWQAWLFLLVFSVSVLLITFYFLQKDPRLIESRLKAGPAAEQEKSQKAIQALASLFFVLPFMIASLDHGFGWSHVPAYLVLLGDVLVVLGFALFFSSLERTASLPRRSRSRRSRK